jgi:hypothetical protein
MGTIQNFSGKAKRNGLASKQEGGAIKEDIALMGSSVEKGDIG